MISFIVNAAINIYAAVYNALSSLLWPLNWRIWWAIAAHTHQRTDLVESAYNIVLWEMCAIVVLIALAAYIVVRRVR
ncbi:hypothetical protein N007_05390 [Alicyclobacillus acidoterrestris ATCC 49025]|nr:hypothetical protein N007_05390 [Alicyclobacillus acidoterrestris ATCC 49025]